MTDPLDVRVEWVWWCHIWHCFQQTWKTYERCLFEQKSTWENFLFCGAAHSKASIKAANMYLLFGWMAWNTNLLAFWSINLREECVHMSKQPSCEEVQVFSATAQVYPGANVYLFVYKYTQRATSISVIPSYPLVWFPWKSSELPKTKGDLKTVLPISSTCHY